METKQKMEFTKTGKRQGKLVKDGYIYVFKKMLAKKRWEMLQNNVNLSPIDKFTEQVNDYTNAPSPTQIKVTKIKVGMKLKAKTTEETAQQILGKQLVNISEDATESLPLIATMRHNIQKAQKRWKHSPDSTKF